MTRTITIIEAECLGRIAQAAYWNGQNDVFYAIIRDLAEATKPWLTRREG